MMKHLFFLVMILATINSNRIIIELPDNILKLFHSDDLTYFLVREPPFGSNYVIWVKGQTIFQHNYIEWVQSEFIVFASLNAIPGKPVYIGDRHRATTGLVYAFDGIAFSEGRNSRVVGEGQIGIYNNDTEIYEFGVCQPATVNFQKSDGCNVLFVNDVLPFNHEVISEKEQRVHVFTALKSHVVDEVIGRDIALVERIAVSRISTFDLPIGSDLLNITYNLHTGQWEKQ